MKNAIFGILVSLSFVGQSFANDCVDGLSQTIKMSDFYNIGVGNVSNYNSSSLSSNIVDEFNRINQGEVSIKYTSSKYNKINIANINKELSYSITSDHVYNVLGFADVINNEDVAEESLPNLYYDDGMVRYNNKMLDIFNEEAARLANINYMPALVLNKCNMFSFEESKKNMYSSDVVYIVMDKYLTFEGIKSISNYSFGTLHPDYGITIK